MSGSDWPALLKRVYPDYEDLAASVRALLDDHKPASPRPANEPWSERDAWLITYADQFGTSNEVPLRSLHRFYRQRLEPWLNGVHILPFYPWSSDDGYSVVDYLSVDAAYGTWDDVELLGRAARIMYDAVINHVSTGSEWFRGYLAGDSAYEDFFIALPPDTDLSAVVRPRTTPLLTAFSSAEGEIHVWTTFSADQVDLNYRNPKLMLEILRVLLEYAGHRPGRRDDDCQVDLLVSQFLPEHQALLDG